MIQFAKRILRDTLLRLFRSIVENEVGGQVLAARMVGKSSRVSTTSDVPWVCSPYDDVGVQPADATGVPPIFVSGRFRTGSTLLWNIFRQIPDITSYYEPFNERRWFCSQRGERIDATHRNVSDYWAEYEGVGDLSPFFDDAWTHRRLFMGAGDHDCRMRDYIDALVGAAQGTAVLQFNRLDFRLPWLRQQYPNSKVLHIYRHPRDQWCSTLSHGESFGPSDGTLRDFLGSDGFYLTSFIQDLEHCFPVLESAWDQHPYVGFYYIWKLSFMFGREYADHSLSMEELVLDTKVALSTFFDLCGIEDVSWERILQTIERPRFNKWVDYAPASWFGEIETRCDRDLKNCYHQNVE